MLSRLFFFLIAAFWVVMNVLLVRQEFGSKKNSDSPVSIEAAEAIDKSYPDFYRDLELAGVTVTYN